MSHFFQLSAAFGFFALSSFLLLPFPLFANAFLFGLLLFSDAFSFCFLPLLLGAFALPDFIDCCVASGDASGDVVLLGLVGAGGCCRVVPAGFGVAPLPVELFGFIVIRCVASGLCNDFYPPPMLIIREIDKMEIALDKVFIEMGVKSVLQK